MTDTQDQQLDNYRLIRQLGAGSFGKVYLGEHTHEHTPAAVKLLQARLTPEDLKQFINEASATFRLQHPNIVRLLDFGISKDGTPFLAMAYAPNGTLRQRHPKGTQVPLPTIVSYVRQVASALQYAHDERLIHRDVKPENILLGPNHEVWLSDFGIATIARSTSSQSEEKMTGTIPYMSPEQIQRRPRPASDQYSLGVVVYEWLCGECPFHGSFSEITRKHLLVPHPPLREKLPEILPDLDHIII